MFENAPNDSKKTETNNSTNEHKFEIKKDKGLNRDKIKPQIFDDGIKKFLSFNDFDK